VLQWCIMTAPLHAAMLHALENFASLIELEYVGLSGIKMVRWDKFSKMIYCVTGPQMFTAAVREFVVHSKVGYSHAFLNVSVPLLKSIRLASRDFIHEGAVFKFMSTNGDKHHYTRISTANLLSSYWKPGENVSALVQGLILSDGFDGHLVQGGSRSIFMLEGGKKREIANFEVFLAHNFTINSVMHLSPELVAMIPDGLSLLS
jgi:hypothetical protein